MSDEEKTRQAQERAGAQLARLVGIMARLRGPNGCPWDKEQDWKSLRPYLVEEAFEVLEAMEGGDTREHCEELGDLLFQIVFQAELAREKGEWELADVARAIADKLEYRHPHVFGALEVSTSEQVLDNWVRLKAAEKAKKRGHRVSVIDGVPKDAPALLRAERMTEKASRIGFDWPTLADVRAKLTEELGELDEALARGAKEEIEHELGDVLFSLANLARFTKTPAEDALRGTIRRFERRFHHVEAVLADRGYAAGVRVPLEELDAIWNEAKQLEREGRL